MGRSVNKVTLIGTLGRDPEVRQMPNGNTVANISLATDESYNDKQTGQKVEQTEWHRLVIYGRLAEICQQYLKKGSRAYFEGRLKTRKWEKDGIERYTTEITCFDMMMLDSRGDNMGSQMGGAPAMNSGYQAQNHAPAPNMAAPQAQQPMQQPYQPAPQASAPAGYQPQPAQQPMHQPAPAQSAPQQAAAPQPSNAFDDFDDDIPF